MSHYIATKDSSTSTHPAVSERPAKFRDIPCDVMQPDCPARELLSLLAEKWTLLAVHALSQGPMRSGILRRRIGGISEKMLFQTLKRLESTGLVKREDYNETPLRVEYSLTELGRSLSPIVLAFDRWTEEHAFDFQEGPAQLPLKS
jgi:DNA-binding HxlR family transcriptional regulator